MNRNDWKSDLGRVITDWDQRGTGHVVIDPDVDGLSCAALLGREYEVEVIGLYNGRRLRLFDDWTPEDALNSLWLDQDVSHPQISCIGQHLVHHEPDNQLPLRSELSWNPNVWQRQSWSQSFRGEGAPERDKYPLGTAHFIADYLDFSPDDDAQLALLAHLDRTWFNAERYAPNFRLWQDLMFPEVDFIERIGPGYAGDPEIVESHNRLVDRLLASGIRNDAGEGNGVQDLPLEQQRMCGRQKINWGGADPQGLVDNFRTSLDCVQEILGSRVNSGQGNAGQYVEGVVRVEFPEGIVDRFGDFDQMATEEEIFSHAFTDLLRLRYTTGMDL